MSPAWLSVSANCLCLCQVSFGLGLWAPWVTKMLDTSCMPVAGCASSGSRLPASWRVGIVNAGPHAFPSSFFPSVPQSRRVLTVAPETADRRAPGPSWSRLRATPLRPAPGFQPPLLQYFCYLLCRSPGKRPSVSAYWLVSFCCFVSRKIRSRVFFSTCHTAPQNVSISARKGFSTQWENDSKFVVGCQSGGKPMMGMRVGSHLCIGKFMETVS